jgi:hypothetical protein
MTVSFPTIKAAAAERTRMSLPTHVAQDRLIDEPNAKAASVAVHAACRSHGLSAKWMGFLTTSRLLIMKEG